MNPQDAKKRALLSGDIVKAHNDLAGVQFKLKVTEDVRPGVVYSPKGAWARSSPNGETSNALIPNNRADLAKGACYNDTLVEVSSV